MIAVTEMTVEEDPVTETEKKNERESEIARGTVNVAVMTETGGEGIVVTEAGVRTEAEVGIGGVDRSDEIAYCKRVVASQLFNEG